jgi:tetratricopeptide (TPR) repeat protein
LSRRAVGLDPLNPGSWQTLGEIELWVGQLDQAAADAKKALELSPDVWPGPIVLSTIYIMLGRPDDALPQIELIRYEPERAYLHAIVYHALGRKKESDTALSELIAKYPRNTYTIADVYAYRNQYDEAFQWLERAYAQHDSGLIETKMDPFLKNLHKDPRFGAFLKKLNLPN